MKRVIFKLAVDGVEVSEDVIIEEGMDIENELTNWVLDHVDHWFEVQGEDERE